MKKNRRENIMYLTHRKAFVQSQPKIDLSAVKVREDGDVMLAHQCIKVDGYYVISRSHARLLAKRILQALEATK